MKGTFVFFFELLWVVTIQTALGTLGVVRDFIAIDCSSGHVSCPISTRESKSAGSIVPVMCAIL